MKDCGIVYVCKHHRNPSYTRTTQSDYMNTKLCLMYSAHKIQCSTVQISQVAVCKKTKMQGAILIIGLHTKYHKFSFDQQEEPSDLLNVIYTFLHCTRSL